jgi:single-strand DNA-binding protein
MPFHLNQVNIAGTMTRDAEINYTPKGTAVANLSLAINRVWKDEGGTKHEETTFVEVAAFGRTAEIIGEYTAKGHTIFIQGRLKLDQWDDKQTGKKRSKLSVVCEKFSFVSSPKNEEGGDDAYEEPPPVKQPASYGTGHQKAAPPSQRSYKQSPKPIDPDLDAADGDDIPF